MKAGRQPGRVNGWVVGRVGWRVSEFPVRCAGVITCLREEPKWKQQTIGEKIVSIASHYFKDTMLWQIAGLVIPPNSCRLGYTRRQSTPVNVYVCIVRKVGRFVDWQCSEGYVYCTPKANDPL